MAVKLNIGAGDTVIDGFTPIDRKNGHDAFPLDYADGSVDEIRASHVLEHFSFTDVTRAVNEWVRVLKPGGRIRIAVPDVRKLDFTQDNWRFHLMGGQTDCDNFHRSAFDEPLLRRYMQQAGLVDVRPWASDNTDSASLPVSLNLEGFKGEVKEDVVKIVALMSIPRVGWNDAWGQVFEALAPFRIPVRRFTGVYWGQCMQRSLEGCIADGLDWVLCIDYDSMFTAKHVDRLMGEFGNNAQIDALAAMQCRRNQKYPLMTLKGQTECAVTLEPMKVTTAHFGLTLLRLDALRDVPKPWFKSEPDDSGEWGDKRLDDDIWFWHQWRLAGKTIYVSPNVRIGHLELMVSEFDSELKHRHVYVSDWRDREGIGIKKSEEGIGAGNNANAVELKGSNDEATNVVEAGEAVGSDGCRSCISAADERRRTYFD